MVKQVQLQGVCIYGHVLSLPEQNVVAWGSTSSLAGALLSIYSRCVCVFQVAKKGKGKGKADSGAGLTASGFEAIINQLELAHLEALKERAEEWEPEVQVRGPRALSHTHHHSSRTSFFVVRNAPPYGAFPFPPCMCIGMPGKGRWHT